MAAPDRAGLTELADRVILANSPASSDEIGKVILELLMMYGEFEKRGEASKTIVINRWKRALTHEAWPVDIIEKASDSWIKGKNAGFVPQPGNIIVECEKIGAYRRAMAKRAAEFMEMAA